MGLVSRNSLIKVQLQSKSWRIIGCHIDNKGNEHIQWGSLQAGRLCKVTLCKVTLPQHSSAALKIETAGFRVGRCA